MEIVIKIPEEWFDDMVREEFIEVDELCSVIQHGKLLPKGHGRLIILSEDIVKRELTSLSFSCQEWISEVGLSNATVAIIEADKAESEG